MNNLTLILAQVLGFIGFIISLLAFKKKKKEKILGNMILSNIFDLSFKASYSLISEKEFVSKIVDSLIYEDKKIEKFFKQLENILNNCVKKKIS